MLKGEIVDYLGWLSLMSTLEESSVENSGNTKVWVMDPRLSDVNMNHYFFFMVDKK